MFKKAKLAILFTEGNMTKQHWYTVGGIILALFLFQTLFRYEYTKMNRDRMVRIDRLTGTACNVPCLPTPEPAPEPTSTPFDRYIYIQAFQDAYDDEKLAAIQDAKNAPMMDGIRASNVLTGYTWKTNPGFDSTQSQISDDGAIPDPKKTPLCSDDCVQNRYSIDKLPKTLEVRYQNDKGLGWSWEWHRDSHAVYFVGENADLIKKYGYK
jgi:hypothetical protein